MPQASRTKSRIKEMARQTGIDGIGICDCTPLEEARRAFEVAADRGFIPAGQVPRRGTLTKLTTPALHLKGARSVISAYQSYFTGEPPCTDPNRGTIAPYTRSNHYEDLRLRLQRLAGTMETSFNCKTKVFSCYVTLAEKPLAQRAGLGFYGKNGVIVTPTHGSFVVLGEVITDLDIEPDERLNETCGSCRLCMERCPTGAIRMPYFVDRRLCIQHLSQRRGVIAGEIRRVWQNRLYGCSDCQDTCRYNSDLSPVGRVVARGAVGSSVALAEMLTIDDNEFEARFANNQIGMRERNPIRRNAIIAVGNSRSETYMPALRTCVTDPDPMIRQHTLWAISEIEGPGARGMLEGALRTEEDASVRAEIKTLLDGLTLVG